MLYELNDWSEETGLKNKIKIKKVFFSLGDKMHWLTGMLDMLHYRTNFRPKCIVGS